MRAGPLERYNPPAGPRTLCRGPRLLPLLHHWLRQGRSGLPDGAEQETSPLLHLPDAAEQEQAALQLRLSAQRATTRHGTRRVTVIPPPPHFCPPLSGRGSRYLPRCLRLCHCLFHVLALSVSDVRRQPPSQWDSPVRPFCMCRLGARLAACARACPAARLLCRCAVLPSSSHACGKGARAQERRARRAAA